MKELTAEPSWPGDNKDLALQVKNQQYNRKISSHTSRKQYFTQSELSILFSFQIGMLNSVIKYSHLQAPAKNSLFTSGHVIIRRVS